MTIWLKSYKSLEMLRRHNGYACTSLTPKIPMNMILIAEKFQNYILCNLHFWISPSIMFRLLLFLFFLVSSPFCICCWLFCLLLPLPHKKTDSYTPRYVSCRYQKKRTIPLTCMNLTWTFVDGIHSVENMNMHINLVVVNRTRFKKLRVCWRFFFLLLQHRLWCLAKSA